MDHDDYRRWDQASEEHDRWFGRVLWWCSLVFVGALAWMAYAVLR